MIRTARDPHPDPPRKTPRRGPPRLAAVLLVLALAALAGATAYPVTVVDDLGREVVLREAPRRVVAMMPSHTETVCALGACDRLVGVDRYSDHPAETAGLPRLGDGFSPNVEGIVALEPDLVLVDQFSGLAATLEGLGLTVYAGTPQGYDEVFEFFERLGLMLDREDRAALLAGRVRGAVDAISALTASRDAPRVFVEIDATPYSAGPGSYLGELVARAGGANIVEAGMGDYPQLDPEFVVAADPQVVLLTDAPFGESAATLAARPGWAGIAALRDGRVVELSQAQVDALNRPGPRIAEAVRMLAEFLHPDLF